MSTILGQKLVTARVTFCRLQVDAVDHFWTRHLRRATGAFPSPSQSETDGDRRDGKPA